MGISLDLSLDRNKVRIIIGDTTNPFLLEDTVVDYILDTNSNDVDKASIEALKYIVASLSRKVDQEVGDVRVTYSQMLKNYKDLLDDLQKDPSRMANVALPIMGGTTKSEIDRVNNNSETPNYGLISGFFTDTQSSVVDTDNPYLTNT